MDRLYWIRRQQAAVTLARAAISSEARLVHYPLVGRYSFRSARSFLLPRTGPESEIEAMTVLPRRAGETFPPGRPGARRRGHG